MVPTVFLPTGKVFDAAMQRALAARAVTRDLTGALNNPRVAWAHRVEFVMIGLIVVFMVGKPF
jgi:hypothetical protein